MSRRRPSPPLPRSSFEYALLHAWLSVGEVPPAIDRWLPRYIREHVKVQTERRVLGARAATFMDGLCAWGTLASFSAFCRRRPPLEAVASFSAAITRPRDLLQTWKQADESFVARIQALMAGADPDGVKAALQQGDLNARCIAAGVPPWQAPYLARRAEISGEEWLNAFLVQQAVHPPLWLRLNQATEMAAVVAELQAQGFEVTESEGALRVVGLLPLEHTEAWKRGAIEIQDRGSQRVGEAVPLSGRTVWDACAGYGGKTLQLSSRLRGKGVVYASDIEEERLTALKERARRAGVPNIRTSTWDGTQLPTFPLEVQRHGGFHAILVDAPCSGSGTWRRRPDGRLRQSIGLAKLVETQSRILKGAAAALRPGGALVYATCSVWVEENETVVKGFLAEHPDFSLGETRLVGGPGEDADSLFYAVLSRAV